ncbi:YkgJ family cysteine cluster protein [Pseudomonadota bacterium]
MSAGQIPPYVEQVIANVAEIGANALAQIRTVDELAQLTEGVYGFCEVFTDDLSAQEPPPQPIACEQGCWYCCVSPRVEALPIEVLVAAHWITANQTPAPLAQLIDAHTNEDAPDFTAPGRTCPLLVDRGCAIYAVRPFVCRSFNAYNRDDCKAKKVDGKEAKILGYAHQGLSYQAALSGLAQACQTKGLAAQLVDLPSALAVALKDVEVCTQKWLAGEDVFPVT